MPKLKKSIQYWNSDKFKETLKSEITNLPPGILPLEKCLTQGGYVDDSNISVTVLNATDDQQTIKVKIGVFYIEIVICCGCGDDPMPTNAYGELMVTIDKQTGEAVFDVLHE